MSSGSNAVGVFNFNGCSNVTIDGRISATGTTSVVTIANTAVGTGAGSTTATTGISGTTMTVTAMSTGRFFIGQTISGTGITAGTTITGFGTGTGGTGTYTISVSHSTLTNVTVTASSAAGLYAVAYSNDASNNTLNYLTLVSGNASTTGGTVYFGVGIITGSDNNTVSNSTFGSNSGSSFNFTGTATSASTSLSVTASTGNLAVGQALTGTGIASGTIITAFTPISKLVQMAVGQPMPFTQLEQVQLLKIIIIL
ncbi:MAG: hypothetical protein NTZ59_11415 [Bacteroidetes bacterium]|nr:hypothetical protein [Bacteroidota bacterium]